MDTSEILERSKGNRVYARAFKGRWPIALGFPASLAQEKRSQEENGSGEKDHLSPWRRNRRRRSTGSREEPRTRE